MNWIDHLTTLYVPGFAASLYPLDPIVNVMDRLREPGGCPWDREQTHESLKKYLIEETYEVIEAIEENNMYKLREELGDLLLQVVFHSRLASEKNIFTINDVVDEVTDKMIRRHPHVFKNMALDTSKEVEKTWEKIKKHEKNKTKQISIIDVPRGLPGLLRAQKVQSKVSGVGFDWPDIFGPWEKISEELNELKEANEKNNKDNIFEELGDLLFATVNLARFLDIDSEEALNFSIDKFTKRFRYIEQKAAEKNVDLESMSLEKMDKLWNESKKMS
jgi:tetrapyrrole methylase family protein/MazG family protein